MKALSHSGWHQLLALLFLFPPGLVLAQSPASTSNKVVVVQLNSNLNPNNNNAYLPQFDAKRVDLALPDDDVLLNLDDYDDPSDALEDRDCVVPSLKLIYKDFTYIISMYCLTTKKFKNSSPFVPSASPLKNDMVLTEPIYKALEKIQKTHFLPELVQAHKRIAMASAKDEDMGKDDFDSDLDKDDDAFDKVGDATDDEFEDPEEDDFDDDKPKPAPRQPSKG